MADLKALSHGVRKANLPSFLFATIIDINTPGLLARLQRALSKMAEV